MFQVAVFNPNQHTQNCITESALTIGSTLQPIKNASESHLVIEDALISDLQARIKWFRRNGQPRISISNFGNCIILGAGSRLHQGMTEELDLPCTIYVGDSQVEFSLTGTSERDSEIRQFPVFGSQTSDILQCESEHQVSPAPTTLNSWFSALSQIQRSTASQSHFFKLAARAVFNPGGLDGCLILKKVGDEWKIVSQHLPFPESGISYRRALVQLAEKRQSVLYHSGIPSNDNSGTDQNHSAVVCPVIDEQENIVAMVYGFRCNHRRNNRRGIRDLEAKFVSLIADAVSAGMIRMSHEASGARRRVLLQQAFSSRVAEQLESNPEFPSVENREVSVLFADIRSFCTITESLGCHQTYHLLSDIMDRFTSVIHRHDGVVIDYYGDGISAFWNAPVDQPDHPKLACRAGMEILESLHDLNQKWAREIGRELRIGLGVTTGEAQIGNSGSRLRLKYGPQGTTVNLASRLEQATKKIGVSFVVSGLTAERVKDDFASLRICSAEFSGIQQSVDVMQLFDRSGNEEDKNFSVDYAEALAMFENEDFLDVLSLLTRLFEQYPDQPLIEFLMANTVSRLSGENQHHEIISAAKQRLQSRPMPRKAAPNVISF